MSATILGPLIVQRRVAHFPIATAELNADSVAFAAKIESNLAGLMI